MGRDEAITLAESKSFDLVEIHDAKSPQGCKFAPRQHDQPEVQVPAAPLLLSEAPTPLALAMREFDQETQPFRKVHRLVDAMEVFTKLHTVVIVSDLFSSRGLDDKTKGMLAAGLRTPSLGIWWEFAREFARIFKDGKAPAKPFMPEFVECIFPPGSQGLRAHMDGQQNNFISFRNDYAHGATPPDEMCRTDIARFEPLLRQVVASATHLREGLWLSVDSHGQCHRAVGEVDQPVDAPCGGLEPGHTYLVRGGATLSLHPLLVRLETPDRFYFYNDLKARAANFLNYESALHHQDATLREALLDRYPIDDWKKPPPSDFLQRIQELTETFKGRREELGKMLRFVEDRSRGFLMVWGGPGIGKSALLARYFQILGWPPEMRVAEELGPRRDGGGAVKTLEYFIKKATNNTDNADHLLENLSRRLELMFTTGIPIGDTTEDKARRLGDRLEQVGKQLGKDRLVILIDGLDEGCDAPGLLDALPKTVPEGVLVIYSSRAYPKVRERVYLALDRERREELDLGGLTPGDARVILSEHVSKYALQPDYLAEVAKVSQGNPLYLKLLAEGLRNKDYDLNEAARLPRGMEDIYEVAIKRIAGTPHALELLRLLAVARDFVSARMAGEMLGIPTTDDPVGTRLFPACLELLYENPHTPAIEDYQLFHESLRDYLRLRYRKECVALEKQLYDWCLGWNDLADESRKYALRHLAGHARAVLTSTQESHNPACLAGILTGLHDLAGQKEYQQASFDTLGEGSAYQDHCRLLLDFLGKSEPEGQRPMRGIAALWNYHVQPRERYVGLLEKIDAGGAGTLEMLDQLAMAGGSPTGRVLLALRGLAAQSVARPIPDRLRKSLEAWCEESGSDALKKLCSKYLALTNETNGYE